MPRKLKVYQTSLGFFDSAIAAPSMKAAMPICPRRRHLMRLLAKADHRASEPNPRRPERSMKRRSFAPLQPSRKSRSAVERQRQKEVLALNFGRKACQNGGVLSSSLMTSITATRGRSWSPRQTCWSIPAGVLRSAPVLRAGRCPFSWAGEFAGVVQAHDALRSRASPGQLSRMVSVVTVSTCSPNRFI